MVFIISKFDELNIKRNLILLGRLSFRIVFILFVRLIFLYRIHSNGSTCSLSIIIQNYKQTSLQYMRSIISFLIIIKLETMHRTGERILFLLISELKLMNNNYSLLKNGFKNNNNSINFIFLSIFSIIMLLTGFLYLQDPSHIDIVFAHKTEAFGNITLEVGWSTEPPLVDEMNNVILLANKIGAQINNTSEENSPEPIRNALSDMNVLVQYGGITKQLSFIPSAESSGLYESSIIPTRIGSYNLILNGTIQDQSINAEIPIEPVESKEKLTFPPQQEEGVTSQGDSGSESGDNTIIGSNLQNILSELDNDIRLNVENMAELSNNTQSLQNSINELGEKQNLPYMLAMTAIGISIGAVLISGFSISRKQKQNK